MLLMSHLNPAYAADRKNRFTLSSGAYFSTGDYGLEESTQILATPISLRYSASRWSAGISTAFLRVDGSEDILVFEEGGIDEPLEGFIVSERSIRQGIGDTLLSLSFKPIWKPSFNSRLQISTKIKIPTSSEENRFSSGELDYSFRIGITHRIKRFLINGKVGYQIMGDVDNEEEYRDYNNRLFFSLGGSYIVNRYWSLGGGYRYKDPSRDGKADISKVNSFVTWRPHKDWSYTVYSALGLTDATADVAAGLQVSYKFH